MFGLLKRLLRRHGARMRDNLRVGKPETRPDKPSHVPGIREGNRPKDRGFRKQGMVPGDDARIAKATAKRSTGIRPGAHDPIDPRMPNLPPS